VYLIGDPGLEIADLDPLLQRKRRSALAERGRLAGGPDQRFVLGGGVHVPARLARWPVGLHVAKAASQTQLRRARLALDLAVLVEADAAALGARNPEPVGGAGDQRDFKAQPVRPWRGGRRRERGETRRIDRPDAQVEAIVESSVDVGETDVRGADL